MPNNLLNIFVIRGIYEKFPAVFSTPLAQPVHAGSKQYVNIIYYLLFIIIYYYACFVNFCTYKLCSQKYSETNVQ